MNFFKAKILLIALSLLSLVYFSNDFGLINVEKSAIVTAIGLDAIEDELKLSMQVAVPETAQTSGSSKSTVFTARGVTVAEAVSNISTKTGWFPKLSFCNVLILGKQLCENDVMKYVDYFSKSLKIQGSALLAVADFAEKILSTATPLDNVSSFALQKILLPTDGMETTVLSSDVKDFTIGYSSRTSSSYAPYVSFNKTPSVKKANAEEGSSNTDSATYVYDASTTAIFKNGVIKDYLTEDETRAMVYIKKDQRDTFITEKNINIDSETGGYTLAVNKSKTSVKVKPDCDAINVTIKQKLEVKTADESFKNKKLSDYPLLQVPKEVLKNLESTASKTISSLLKKTFKHGVDLLGLDDKLYRFYNKQYDSLKEQLYLIDNVFIEIKAISSQ